MVRKRTLADRPYYRFYFLKGDVANPTIYETLEHWNMVCKAFPYNVIGEVKDVPTIDWADEDGVEVYIPDGGIPLKEQVVDIEFVCYSSDARRDMAKFRNFVLGRDGTGVVLGVYDSFTGLSGANVLYQNFKPDLYHTEVNGMDVVVFKITFKFCSPMLLDRVIKPKNGSFNDDFNESFNTDRIKL